MHATLGKHETDHSLDQCSKHHLHNPPTPPSVLSSHISLVCGYHKEKHSHVMQVHMSRCVPTSWAVYSTLPQTEAVVRSLTMALHKILGCKSIFHSYFVSRYS